MNSGPDERHLLDHSRFLHRLVRSVVLDEGAVGDVVQETWLAGRTNPPPASFNLAGWFTRVARRLAGRMRRASQRRSAREQAVARPERTDSTVDAVSREEILRVVTQTVLALDEPYRSAVMQRYYEDLSPEEIAARCDVPVATIKSRLQRAREKLRERLDAKLHRDLREALGWIGGIPTAASAGTVVVTGGAKLAWSAGLIVAAGAAWWIGAGVLQQRAPASQERGAAVNSVNANAVARAPQQPPAAAKRAAEPIATDATTPAANEEFRGSGSITLTIVDAATGAALPDVPFIVYSERPRIHVFRRAVTDASGAATIRELPEDVIVFETGRRPPHANTVLATWLKSGEQKSVEMRLTHGGTVHGRVVDDAGAPIEAVDVAIDPRPGGYTLADVASVQGDEPEVLSRFANRYEPVTTTDAQGRYEVATLLARPTAIWIEAKTMRPKRQEGVVLTFRWQLTGAQLAAKTDEGQTSELQDLVLERVRRFAGRVVDPAGKPLGGALVSTRYERTEELGARAFDAAFVNERSWSFVDAPEGAAFRFDLGPGEEGFALARDETITAGDGTFEVATSCNWYRVLIATRDGTRKHFDLPKIAPGERREGLEFRLPVEIQFELEITEADGQPIAKRSPDSRPVQFRAAVLTRDGIERESELLRAGPTSYGVTFDVEPAAIAQLVVTSHDHVAAVHRFETPPIGRTRLAFALQRRPSFELPFHFHFADESDRAILADVGLQLIARTQPESILASGGDDRDAAGTFDTLYFQPKMALKLTFHVPSRRKWFVSLRGPFAADSAAPVAIALGAFEPDDTTHEVEIPKVSATWLASAERKRQDDAAKGNSEIWKQPQGFAHYTFVDATTHASIAVARIHYDFVRVGETPDAVPPNVWYSSYGEQGAESSAFLQASPGHYTVKVSLHGYRDSAPLSVDIVEKETAEGGTVLLEMLPEHRIRLVQRDGTPVGAGWQLELFTPATLRGGFSFYGFEIATDANGVASIRREWPEGSLLMAWPPDGRLSGPELASRYELAPWPVGETRDLVVPTMRRATVVLDLTAIDPDLRDASCTVHVHFADGPQADHAIGGQAADSSIPLEGRRRFTFTAPPGHYTLRASGRLFSAPDATVEVADGEGIQEFTLVAKPR